MLAVTHARTAPSIAEDAIHLVHLNNLARYGSHELEVVRPECACHPEFRIGPVSAFLAVFRHRNPVRVSFVDILMSSVRIGAGDDIHSKLAATGYEFPETITVTKESAPVVEGYFGRVIGNATARRKTCRVGMRVFEVIEPELT